MSVYVPGAVQSYTWSLTYTVTTSGGSPPEPGSQISCMRGGPPLHGSSSAHRMPVYPHRDEHGWVPKFIRRLNDVLNTTLKCGLWNVFRDLYFISRYTGSYNYSSYANQHHHAIQSQYSSLTHEPGLPTPLHYSSYHRTSSQVRLLPQKW